MGELELTTSVVDVAGNGDLCNVVVSDERGRIGRLCTYKEDAPALVARIENTPPPEGGPMMQKLRQVDDENQVLKAENRRLINQLSRAIDLDYCPLCGAALAGEEGEDD